MFEVRRTEGSRADLVAQLREFAEGCWHLGSDRLWAASKLGIERLQAGDASVRVGTKDYVVTHE